MGNFEIFYFKSRIRPGYALDMCRRIGLPVENIKKFGVLDGDSNDPHDGEYPNLAGKQYLIVETNGKSLKKDAIKRAFGFVERIEKLEESELDEYLP